MKIAIILSLALVLFISGCVSNTGQTANRLQMWQDFPIEGRNHVQEGTKVGYKNSNPPSSGDHWPEPAEWGVYETPLPDEVLVHNIEHGGIWVSYKDIDAETKSRLEAVAGKYPRAVILAPRPENDRKIALVSWGRVDKFESFDEKRIENFIKSNVNNAPEPLASLKPALVAAGAPFPEFELTEVGGEVITKDSLKGKPAVVWFTTSWCVPCQVGALEVSRLDRELGGQAFDVLVIFVDPNERNSDLINWRKQFANEDWIVAFDNELTELARRSDVRYLDSKFLLDKGGIIKNIDFNIADSRYLNLVRQVVEGA